MKILLINPPANIIESRSEIKMCCPPLGLGYIAAVLEKEGHTVEIFDALTGKGYLNETKVRPGFIRYGLAQNEIEEKVRVCGPDIVGISAVHSNRIYEVRETTMAVKNVSREIITIVGGAFASMNSRECLDDHNCDYIVLGEGEATIVELINSIKNKKNVQDVKGIGFRENRQIMCTPRREVIKNLDNIPWPAYHLFDFEEYFNIEMPGARYGKKRYSLFCGSRGCPHSCHYCAKPLLIGEGYRARSIQDMICEIKHLIKVYNIDEFRFVDYHAMADIRRWKEFCQQVIDQGIKCEFTDPHGLAVRALDDDVMELMRKAGFKHLYVSIESADQKYLDTLKKGVDLIKVNRIMKKARELGFATTGYFVIGIPGQSWVEIEKTVEYAKSLELDDVDFFIANPFPGSGLYTESIEKGLLREEYHPSRLKYGLSNLKNSEYSSEMIEEYRQKAWLECMVAKKRREKKNSK
jgi:radical SAM superfamily enzyme YgiQ (UPF0313 family)